MPPDASKPADAGGVIDPKRLEAAQVLYEFVGALGVHGPEPKPWADRTDEETKG